MDLVILARAIHLSHACPPTRWIGGPRAGASCERTPHPPNNTRIRAPATLCVCPVGCVSHAMRTAARPGRDPWCVIGYLRCD